MLVLALSVSLLLQAAQGGRTVVTAPAISPGDGPTRFSGWVVDDQGGAVPGAVVSSSAGGEVRTSGDGSFVLEVEAPSGAETLRLYAELPPGDAPMPSPLLGELEAFVVPGETVSVGSLVLSADDCTERWLPTFGEIAGTRTGRVEALINFDHGAGDRLYVGGSFLTMGGLNERFLARWNGSRYTEVGAGVNGAVFDFAIFDDGSGPALYVAGQFRRAGDVLTDGIARWDGTTWSDVGGGTNGSVQVLEVYDSGGGAALYAGGNFTFAGGVSANRIARWDGLNWTPLKDGLDDLPTAMTVYDDGTGPMLVVGGMFRQAGLLPVSYLARWDDVRWRKYPDLTVPFAVDALTTTTDGLVQALHVGGYPVVSPTPSVYARWTGTAWAPVGNLTTSTGFGSVQVRALSSNVAGPADQVVLGGTFDVASGQSARRIARTEQLGSVFGFKPLLNGVGAQSNQLAVDVLEPVRLDGADVIGIGGFFTRAGTKIAHRVATWDGTEYHALGTGLENEVTDLVELDDGTGSALVVGGAFKSFGDTRAAGVAKWDGSAWSPVGGGGPLLPSITKLGSVEALAVHDDGGGPALWAGGKFAGIDGVAADAIAKFDGTAWSAVGPGFPGGLVIDLASYDDGTGAKLYAAGDMDPTDELHLAAWDGTSWQPVGGDTSAPVRTLGVFDLGGGPVLVVGGQFDVAGGVTVNRIATWDGATWAPLGDGFNGDVNALEWWDDGSGPALYAAGRFTSSGATPARRLARWDGSSWTALGNGVDREVFALEGLDLGEGPALYAGGDFRVAGVGAANRLARWNGIDWAPVQRGLPSRVRRLAAYDDGTGPSLLVGGLFLTSPGRDSFLARFGCD